MRDERMAKPQAGSEWWAGICGRPPLVQGLPVAAAARRPEAPRAGGRDPLTKRGLSRYIDSVLHRRREANSGWARSTSERRCARDSPRPAAGRG